MPDSELSTTALEAPPLPSAARWRWVLHLVIIGIYPPLIGVISAHTHAGSNRAALPTDTRGLLTLCAVELVIFAALLGAAWLASRVNREQLLLRWRGGARPVLLGALYSVALRFGVGIVLVIATGIVVASRAKAPGEMERLFSENRPKVEALVDVAALQHNPIYFWLMLTLVSFIVAGLREELWRSAFLAGMRGSFPGVGATRGREIAAVAVAAVLFGLGHLPMGPIAVVMTGLLGLGLGAIMVWHRSIWEAVLAHGFFNAASFVLIPWAMDKLPKLVPPA